MNIAGGMIGEIYGAVKIENNSVKNAVISTPFQVSGGMFGFIASCKEIDGCTVDNVTIKNDNSIDALSSGSKNVIGGIIGVLNSNNKMNNCSVLNSNLSVDCGKNNSIHIGGVLGYAAADVTMQGTQLIDTHIDNNTPQGVTGGIISMTRNEKIGSSTYIQNLQISNPVITGDKIEGEFHTGGILGFGKIASDGATISDTTIEGLHPGEEEGIADVGGIIGNSLEECTISEVTAERLTIKSSDRAGGIAGINKGTISNSNVSNSTIESTDANSQTGGITGHDAPEGTVNCGNVRDCDIHSNKGMVGVVAGYTNKKEENCDTEGTTAKTDGGGEFGIN